MACELTPQKVVIVTGPTAIGKTATLQKIQQYIQNQFAQHNSNIHGIEIINCDSIQVYQYLDIGSAKPSPQLRSELPHHLIDILNPKEKFTAGDFVRQCNKIIPQIAARQNIPIISGGNVFYLKNFLYGLSNIPAISNVFRAGLEQMSLKELGEKLKELDFQSWQRIAPNDRQRLIRACEVSLETGRSFSSYKTNNEIRKEYQPLIINLSLQNNLQWEDLYQHINLRVENMFLAGLEQEIEMLKQMGFNGQEHGLQGIGYREFFEKNNQEKQPDTPEESKKQLIEKIQQNSRNYAKRQKTFLKQLPNCEYFNTSAAILISKRILEFYMM